MEPYLSRKIALWAGHRRFWPAILFVVSLAVYLASLPRTVSFEDSAEFTAAAATLGVPHPSGYPLYVLLAHVLTWLPFGTVPWRVALFSAVCAAAAISLVFCLARRVWSILDGPAPAAAEALMVVVVLQLAFSEVWWSQAVYAKVYPLHVLLLLAIFWLLLRFAEDPDQDRPLYLAALGGGLALANHLFLALAAAPFLIAAALMADRRLLRPSRRWLFAALCAAAGLAPYALLPWRAAAPAAYVFDPVSGWRGFIDYVLRRRYQDLAITGALKPGLAFELLWQTAIYLGPLLIGLAVLAVWRLARTSRAKRRAAAVILSVCLGGVLAAPLAMLARTTDWTDHSSYLSRVYGLAGHACLTVLAAYAAGRLVFSERPAARRTARAWIWFFALLPLLSLSANWLKIQAYSSDLVDDYGRQLLGRLAPRAVLIVNDQTFTQDTELFTLAYLQQVEHLRPDVTVVEDVGIRGFYTPRLPAGYAQFDLDLRRRLLFEAALSDNRFNGRPLYTSFAPEYVIKGFLARSNGLAFRLERLVWPQPEGSVGTAPVAPLPLPPRAELEGQMALGLVASHLLYNEAAQLVEQQGKQAAVGDLVEAIKLDTTPMSDDYRGFMAHRAAAGR